MTSHTNRKQSKIIVKWDDGSDHQQTCATEYVARECMKALRADAAIKRAMAYYTDDRGAFDTYERRA